MGNIVVIIILVIAIGAVIKSMIKRRKEGKSLGCGGNCQSCMGASNCKIKNDDHL